MGKQDLGESDFIDGTIEKKGYRKRWVRNVEKKKGHPFNAGIHMDTHHLISAEAVKNSNLGGKLVEKGYDINDLKNLVGYPATLPGACLLKTQLHRGDHFYAKPKEKAYHEYVAGLVVELESEINDCYGRTSVRETDADVHKLLDPIGKIMFRKINRFIVPLTEIYMNFHPSEDGCGNCFNVKEVGESIPTCNSGRKHFGDDWRYSKESAAKGNKKNITFKLNGSWKPEKVGE